MPASPTPAVVDRLEPRRLFADATRVVDADTYYLGDINGDLKADLAIPGPRGVGIRLGNGDGTFAAPAWYELDLTAVRVAGGDVNGDGRLDLIATTAGGNGIIAVLIGLQQPPTGPAPTADALFDDPFFFDVNAVVSAGFGGGPRVRQTLAAAPVLVGDFDGSSGDEIVYVDEPRGILIALLLPLTGSGFPTGTVTFLRSPFAKGVRIAAGDVTGDGRADLVGLDSRGTVHVAVNGGGLGVWDDTDVVPLFPPRVRVDHVAVGDVNGDGVSDIVALSNGRASAYTLSDVLISSIVTDFDPVPRAIQSGIKVADVTGDGRGDLFALVRTGEGILPYMEQQNI